MSDRVTRIAEGAYRIEHDGRAHIVYVAGNAADWWAYSEGQVFRAARTLMSSDRRRATAAAGATPITAPLPATVAAVSVTAGDRVRKGDVLIVLDAMKMEMPVRADTDGTVKTVRCSAGELVQADAVLVEIE